MVPKACTNAHDVYSFGRSMEARESCKGSSIIYSMASTLQSSDDRLFVKYNRHDSRTR